MSDPRSLIVESLNDARHGWSIGTFGAIGEFIRDADETAVRNGPTEVYTDRGGIRLTPREDVRVVAFDSLSSDGETWGQSVLFCLPLPDAPEQGQVRRLGLDQEALRPQDRDATLFDTGVGKGHVRMCVRTRDLGLIAALEALEGRPLLSAEAGEANRLILQTSPHRVMLSPLGRVEVYQPIPGPGGSSPSGPHTHLMPRMIASGRTHAANSPVPAGLQPVLSLHPRSPWRDDMGRRTPFDASLDAHFDRLLASFGLPEDRAVRESVETAVEGGAAPGDFKWPETRRGRTQARITLRRLARRKGPETVQAWRSLYDRADSDEPEADEEAAMHAS